MSVCMIETSDGEILAINADCVQQVHLAYENVKDRATNPGSILVIVTMSTHGSDLKFHVPTREEGFTIVKQIAEAMAEA